MCQLSCHWESTSGVGLNLTSPAEHEGELNFKERAQSLSALRFPDSSDRVHATYCTQEGPRPRRRISGARRRGLLRLVLLVALVGWLVVLAARGLFSGGSKTHTASTAGPSAHARTAPPKAATSSLRLPNPLHGATAATSGNRLLVIGGADRADVSTDMVLALDPRTGKVSSGGTLVQAMHDAAAAAIGGRTLVFGGGAATGFDIVQELVPGGAAHQIGRLPVAASDLSAVTSGGATYVLGGYDGQGPVDSVFRSTDGRSFTRVAQLPTAVRYTAAAAIGNRVYAFGGELSTGANTAQLQEYDTGAEEPPSGRLPQGVDHASALVLNGVIYLVGGRRNGAASDRILRLDPSRHTVVPAGRLPSPVFDAASGTVAGVGYLAGGIGAGNERGLRGGVVRKSLERRRSLLSMRLLRRISTRRLLALCAACVVGGIGATAIAMAATGGGPTPTAEPLPVAVHDALTAPTVEGVSARIQFTNHLVSGADVQGADPILSGASARLWASSDGHLRLELRRTRTPRAPPAKPGAFGWPSRLGLSLRVQHGLRGILSRRPRRSGCRKLGERAAAIPRRNRAGHREAGRARMSSGAQPTDVAGQAAYTVRVEPKSNGGLSAGPSSPGMRYTGRRCAPRSTRRATAHRCWS